MEIWLDTCDSEVISNAHRLGILYGVTTNPSILAKADENHDIVINRILDNQNGSVAVQVTAYNADEMIKQAEALRAFSDRIIVKIPVVQDGLVAIKHLSRKNIPIMATAIFQPHQALLAALAGADYVAPYVGRIFDEGIDAYDSLETMQAIYKTYQFKTKILAAALRTPEQIMKCARLGIHAVTLKSTLFSQFSADDESTLNCLSVFAEDWDACQHRALSALV
ncbi:MAG TPA: transaldolase family protein [Parachlamydiaceae bacterium]|nr:transaldolase family protein [Parachlamydiaceae bacterium]